jgi:hypothetical protein
MIERHNEHGLGLHMLFVDFKQAFDSKHRKRLFEAIDKMGTPQKLTRHPSNSIQESNKVMVCQQLSL